ncbi:MAG: tripartite tricarboxylate transporter TctB family protein, partial [Candidatus Rokuibacteriota bacterium]
PERRAGPSRAQTRRTAAIAGWILGMYAAIGLLGFSLATLATTIFYLRYARERWPISVALSLACSAFVYALFEKGLSVPFPPGRLLVWLGYGD